MSDHEKKSCYENQHAVMFGTAYSIICFVPHMILSSHNLSVRVIHTGGMCGKQTTKNCSPKKKIHILKQDVKALENK